MHQTSESLAGRASDLTLWPTTRREQRGDGRARRWGELAEEAPWSSGPYGAIGAALLVVEYRGYGSSEGAPSEVHLVDDTLGLIELAMVRTPIDREQIVFHGRSVGGGIASAVARRFPPRALVLESSFSPVVSMGRGSLVPPYLVRDRLDVADCLENHYRGPVLILHSESDEVIPVREARRNARAARRARARRRS